MNHAPTLCSQANAVSAGGIFRSFEQGVAKTTVERLAPVAIQLVGDDMNVDRLCHYGPIEMVF